MRKARFTEHQIIADLNREALSVEAVSETSGPSTRQQRGQPWIFRHRFVWIMTRSLFLRRWLNEQRCICGKAGIYSAGEIHSECFYRTL